MKHPSESTTIFQSKIIILISTVLSVVESNLSFLENVLTAKSYGWIMFLVPIPIAVWAWWKRYHTTQGIDKNAPKN